MRRTEVVLSCLALVGCAPPPLDAPTPAPPVEPVHTATEPPQPTCANDVEALREALAQINAAASPRIAPGPLAPWPAPLDQELDSAFYLRHEDGQWKNDPFDPADPPAEIQAAYAEETKRYPGSAGFLLAADPATPTREVAARLIALEGAGITQGSFNVEVPLAEPILPPDPQWLEQVRPRLNTEGALSTVLADIAIEQLEQWEPHCGDLSWTFDLEGVAPEDRATALAQRFVDGHRACECQTSAERWAALFYMVNFGAQPATTTDGDYRVQLSPKGTVIEFAPNEDWGTTIHHLPAPGTAPTDLWLVETSLAP